MHRAACAVALLIALHGAAALEARWTPAADGGPARFSKRYRDAAGIDDSRWYADGDSGGSASILERIFPSTPGGWLFAIVAAAICLYFYTQQPQGGNTVGRDAAATPSWGGAVRQPPGAASEAAREAFLKRFEQKRD